VLKEQPQVAHACAAAGKIAAMTKGSVLRNSAFWLVDMVSSPLDADARHPPRAEERACFPGTTDCRDGLITKQADAAAGKCGD
jgi:hypothetical protein